MYVGLDDEEFTESYPNSSVEGFEDDEDSDVEEFEDYHENSNFVTKCYQFMDFLQRVSCNGFSSACTSTRTFQFLVARILHVVVSFVHNLSLPTRAGFAIFFFFTDILLLYLIMYIVHHLKVDVKIASKIYE